ncbi:Hypothetical predicted protein [Octopus vulgaris]|uniref:Uncharacterized protein n=1 Tax=Octopus vulgaris TaxID=6645 RepID=A0AA36EWT5_OCTVU|nr:Hypothetical predicted protein [Octopus vulgaris]
MLLCHLKNKRNYASRGLNGVTYLLLKCTEFFLLHQFSFSFQFCFHNCISRAVDNCQLHYPVQNRVITHHLPTTVQSVLLAALLNRWSFVSEKCSETSGAFTA